MYKSKFLVFIGERYEKQASNNSLNIGITMKKINLFFLNFVEFHYHSTMPATIFIRPLPGNKSSRCDCPSWMAHWEKCKGMKAIVCQELNCKNEEIVAAHVIKPMFSNRKTFVIPLCREHRAHHHGEFQIKAQGFLINIEPEESCKAV